MKFKMPTRQRISARTSSITNAFYNGVFPIIRPTDEEVMIARDTLRLSKK